MNGLVVSHLSKVAPTARPSASVSALMSEPDDKHIMPLAARTTRVVTYRGIATFAAEHGAPPLRGPQRFVAHFGYADDWSPTWSDLWVGDVRRWSIECASPWICDRLGRSTAMLTSAAFVSGDDEAVISINSPCRFGGQDPLKKPFQYSLTQNDIGLAEICFVHAPTGGVYRSKSATVVSFSVTSDPEPAVHGVLLKGLCALKTALSTAARSPVVD